MKTDDEIKKGLQCARNCSENDLGCKACPYLGDNCTDLHPDALALIQQLEAENTRRHEVLMQAYTVNEEMLKIVQTIAEDSKAQFQQLEAQVPKWISVEERLPEGEGWVLAIGLLLKKKNKGNYGWCVPHVAEYRHGRWCDSDGMLPDLEERSLKITHWMPLPEPPTKGEES